MPYYSQHIVPSDKIINLMDQFAFESDSGKQKVILDQLCQFMSEEHARIKADKAEGSD